jgi:acetyl-CoA synthetase
MAAPAFGDGDAAVWRPAEQDLQRSRLAGLMRREGAATLEELHRRAVADPEWFWRAAVEDLGIEFSQPFSAVVDFADGAEFPRWFVDGRLNLASNCVGRWTEDGRAEKTAVIWENEAGDSRAVSYAELHREVAALAGYLRSLGVAPGERVGIFMPMIPETAVALMACAWVGAVAVPAFTGYGPSALGARLQAAEARVLISADGFVRRGSVVAMKPTVDAALEQAPSVERVVVVPHLGIEVELRDGRDLLWADALATDVEGAAAQPLELDANDPFLLVYTSGTTGAPKGIVHSHGGFLAKVGADFGYSFDVQEDDVFLWNTDPGWLVGPLLIVAALMFNSTAVFYEGSPDQPDLGRTWALVDRHDVTVVGVAPSLARAMMTAGEELVEPHDRSSLRAFVSTGEAWNEEPWHWLFGTVGEGRLPILNYSGGTEIGGGILTCYPIAPISPGGFSGPVIGLDADVFGPDAEPLRDEVGELVLRNLAPGVTHGFWRDRERYLETYWSRWPGVWLHGDLATRREDGFWFIAGRSDDTIKISGKRVGPAEIEAVVGRHAEVAEVAAVGVPDERSGNAVVCFVVPARPGVVDEERLSAEIAGLVSGQLDKTIRPRRVHVVAALPKTKTGKLMRRVVRARYLGLPAGDLSSIESAETLEAIPVLAESA